MSRRKSKSSQARIDANRRNALKSTGPRTEEGKNRSRLNALRHGLTAQVTVMTEPDRDAQEKFTQAYVADLAPQGAVETQLAQSLAFDAWRMNRVRAVEENAFADGFSNKPGDVECSHPEIHSAMAATRTFFSEPEKFVLLSLYEQRIHRNFHRNLKTFRELQRERSAAPRESAKPLTMAAGWPGREIAAAPAPQVIQNQSPNHPAPTADGFVFSNRDSAPPAASLDCLPPRESPEKPLGQLPRFPPSTTREPHFEPK